MHDASVSKAPDRIAGMFDAIAARYDFLNHFLSAGIDRRWRRAAIRSLKLTGQERLLDLCTGTADVALAAVHATPGAARAHGLDFAGEMLAIAATKIARARLGDRIQLVRADASTIPIVSASVDAITVAFGIRNVEDVAAACAEMRRVLKPGGRLAILEFAVPTTRGFRPIYLWYLRHILPRLGRAISRHPGAYAYLPASIDAFAAPDEFVKTLRHAGFVEIAADRLTFGSVILYTGRRGLGTRD